MRSVNIIVGLATLIIVAVVIWLLYKKRSTGDSSPFNCVYSTGERVQLDSNGKLHNLMLLTSGCSDAWGTARGTDDASFVLTNSASPVEGYNSNATQVTTSVEPLVLEVEDNKTARELQYGEHFKLYTQTEEYGKQRIMLTDEPPHQLVTDDWGGIFPIKSVTFKMTNQKTTGPTDHTVGWGDTFELEVKGFQTSKVKASSDCSDLLMIKGLTTDSCGDDVIWRIQKYQL